MTDYNSTYCICAPETSDDVYSRPDDDDRETTTIGRIKLIKQTKRDAERARISNLIEKFLSDKDE